jgi:hypothetical protein
MIRRTLTALLQRAAYWLTPQDTADPFWDETTPPPDQHTAAPTAPPGAA